MDSGEYVSVPEMARILGLSRIAVYRKVKTGRIKAKKIGRNYAIDRKSVANILGKALIEEDKRQIDAAVSKTVKEYGRTLKLLGRRVMKVVTVREVEYIAFRLAQDMLGFDEPIPDFSSRFPNILESCLATPFQRFSKKALYPTLVSKAAILFYLLIKNHPFQNGNKRIAMTTLLVFLYRNKKWIKVDTQELYNFTVWVAQSPRTVKDETVKAIEKFVKTHLVNLEE